MSSYLIYNNQYLQYSGQYMNYTNFFNIGVGFNDLVRTLAIDSNNKIYVGGDFTTYKNVSENHIIRLNSDGTKDASFDAGTGFNSNVRKIKIDPYDNTKIYVGGNFTSYKNVSEGHFIKLKSDGSKDASFNIGVGFGNKYGANGPLDDIRDMAFDSSGRIFVVGHFHSFQSATDTDTSTEYTARLNSNGSKDITFDSSGGIGTPSYHPGTYNYTDSVFIDISDLTNSIYITGDFQYWRDFFSPGLAKINQNGTYNTLFNVSYGYNQEVLSVFQSSSKKLYVGGVFSGYYDSSLLLSLSCRGLTQINSSTSYTESSLGYGFTGYIINFTEDASKKIYAFGLPVSYKGTSGLSGVMRLNADGTLDNTFNVSTGFGGVTPDVYTVAIDSSNNIYVGGYFTAFRGQTQNHLVRLDQFGNKN